MRFLADECCDFAIVRTLRSLGHDVWSISEHHHQSVDSEVLELAHAEQRILLTEDKDFGWLTFVAHTASPGVVLFRFPASTRSLLSAAVTELITKFEAELTGAFTVVQPGLVRVTRTR